MISISNSYHICDIKIYFLEILLFVCIYMHVVAYIIMSLYVLLCMSYSERMSFLFCKIPKSLNCSTYCHTLVRGQRDLSFHFLCLSVLLDVCIHVIFLLPLRLGTLLIDTCPCPCLYLYLCPSLFSQEITYFALATSIH